MHVFLNGDDLGEAAMGIPKNVFAVVDLHGMVEGIVVISSSSVDTPSASLSPQADTDTHTQVVGAALYCLKYNCLFEQVKCLKKLGR